MKHSLFMSVFLFLFCSQLVFADFISYHITYRMGGGDIYWWPMAGFGEVCTKKKEAEKQLKKEVEGDPNGCFQLVAITVNDRGQAVKQEVLKKVNCQSSESTPGKDNG